MRYLWICEVVLAFDSRKSCWGDFFNLLTRRRFENEKLEIHLNQNKILVNFTIKKIYIENRICFFLSDGEYEIFRKINEWGTKARVCGTDRNGLVLFLEV